MREDRPRQKLVDTVEQSWFASWLDAFLQVCKPARRLSRETETSNAWTHSGPTVVPTSCCTYGTVPIKRKYPLWYSAGSRGGLGDNQ